MMKYLCPVCGYSKLEHPPQDFTICPSCGTEFELDDEVCTPQQLRAQWLRAGAPWFSETIPPPAGWQEYRLEQLMASMFDTDDTVSRIEAKLGREIEADLVAA